MSATARKSVRRRATPATESTVYDGRHLCGTITPKARAFVARLVSGKSIGKFANERLAQRALTAAARSERPVQSHTVGPHAFAWKPGELVVGQGRGDAPNPHPKIGTLS
jgi:hypothetical protein